MFKHHSRVALLVSAAFFAQFAAPVVAKPSSLQPSTPGEPQLDLPRTSIQANMHRIDAQVASTPEQQQTGLMWRREMPANEGMLFVFPTPRQQCFWMRNTLIPLAIAFVADDGTVVNIREMKPLDESPTNCSTAPVRYVLEMNQGWFAKRGIKAGSKLTGEQFNKR